MKVFSYLSFVSKSRIDRYSFSYIFYFDLKINTISTERMLYKQVGRYNIILVGTLVF